MDDAGGHRLAGVRALTVQIMTEVELLAVLIKKFGTPAPEGGLQLIVTDRELIDIDGVVWQHFDHYTHRHFFFLRPPVIDAEVVEDLSSAIAISP